MSAPESIFSITGIKGPTQNTSAESLDNKANEANSALFVSIMEQYAPSGSSKMEPWATPTGAGRAAADRMVALETGKSLPAMPAGLPIVPDEALEEFAVDLGIDRSLARLLLRETAEQGAEDAAALANLLAPSGAGIPVGMGAIAAGQVSGNESGNTPSEGADRMKASVASLAAMRETALGQRVMPAMAGLATPLEAVPVAPISATSVSASPLLATLAGQGDAPLADEDVLRWRAASERGMGSSSVGSATSDAARAELAFKPLGLDALRSPVVTPALSTLVANPVPSAALSASAAGTAAMAATTAATMAASTATIAAAAMPSQDASATRSPGVSNRSGTSNIAILPSVAIVSKDSAAIDPLNSLMDAATVEGAELPMPGREMSALSSDAWLALSASGLRRQGAGAATAAELTNAAISGAAAAAATAPQALLAPGLLPAIDPAAANARPIPLPSTALDYDTRAEQFAEQVGQRLIQQMKSDRWTVSLQLDPRNLGPVDISLEIDGADVRANLAVMNAEVRSLLEAGMPRLRETLEQAGYQLSGWSMADSAGRDAAAQQFAHGHIERALRNADVSTGKDEVGELDGSRIGVSGSERGIDLYV